MIRGDTIGRLTFIKKVDDSNALCLCSCGNKHICNLPKLKRGRPQSCGCLRLDRCRAATSTHGMTNLPEYKVWKTMRQRCNNPNNKKYPKYGGRGIKVCDRWMSSFENFYADMGPRPEGRYSIERIDNDGNYEPSNCKWATDKEQTNNQSSNWSIEYNGKNYTLAGLEELSGVGRDTIKYRLNAGWSVEDAIRPKGKSTLYEYKGSMYKLSEIARMANVVYVSLRKRVVYCNENITDAIKRLQAIENRS